MKTIKEVRCMRYETLEKNIKIVNNATNEAESLGYIVLWNAKKLVGSEVVRAIKNGVFSRYETVGTVSADGSIEFI